MPADPKRLQSIFLAALETDDRPAVLDRECGGDVDLRRHVEKLLAAHDDSAELPIANAATGDYASVAIAKLAPGSVFAGRYKLREQLGEGGMGVVYVADQLEPVQRRVALKIIRANLPTDKLLARFEQERQALALMDHPNIAKVYDAGVADNTPYFVMELIKGLPITKYCDDAKLTPKQRLELFIPVCQAVQHAHQKGIIHRDLKPANIIVGLYDGRPVPKVIDFGVAKMTGPRLTEHSVYTEVGSIIGTLEYMSPEQAELNNLDIDTRTDIYALGVILYELLTGTVPFSRKEMQSAGFGEMLRVIKEQEPSKPSTKLSGSGSLPSVAACRHTEPAKLTRLVRGELDWITMKALEKDRARRYETANGMAMDIQRYLDDEPVLASPPSAAYRMKKFVKRNRPHVIAASVVLFALVAGIVGTSLGLREANRQTGIAQANETRAEAEKKRAIEFRDKALDALRATTGTDVEQLIGGKTELGANEKGYIEAIAKRWQAFAKQEGTDEQARDIRAEGHNRVAYLWDKLGRREEARPEYEQAIVIYQRLAVDFPGVPNYRRQLALNHNNLGYLLAHLGKQAEAREQYNKALAIQEKLAADFPAVRGDRNSLARSHGNLGSLLQVLGNRAEAEVQFNKALAIYEKLAADFPDVPDYRRALAVSFRGLGQLMDIQGKRAEAEVQYTKAIAIQQKLAADFTAVPVYRRDLANSHTHLGITLNGLGRLAEVREQYRQAIVIREKLAAEFPALPDGRRDLAESHLNLATVLENLGKQAEAQEQINKALSILERLSADFPAVPIYRRDLALSHNNLGFLLSNLGKRAEAQEQYNKALAIREKLAADFPAVPDYRSNVAASHGNLGFLLAGLGKRAEAEEQFRKGLVIDERLAADFPAVPRYRIALGGSYCNLGNVVAELARANESLDWYDKAIATLTPVHRAELRDVKAKHFLRNSHLGRAVAHDRLKKFAEAVKDWDRVIELGPPAEQPAYRARRATSQLIAGQVAEAVAEFAELTMESNWNAGQWYDFARVYAVASGKIADKKQEYADRAMELLQKAVKAGYRDVAHMKKDTDLDPIREREDFKKLIAELEAKAEKKKP